MAEHPWFSSVELTDVVLRVADLPQAAAFYENVLGMRPSAVAGDQVALLNDHGTPLVVLQSAPEAARSRGAAGLFHVAFLYRNRPALGAALRRVAAAGVPIGAADHGVSEAIYLSDPEGNGIELYVDRPPEHWPPRQADGQVAMVTEPLDVEALAGEAVEAPGPPARIGHIHLSVADLWHAERFYGDLLGFSVTQRTYPGALFLARDGYHHHIGSNIWRSNRPSVDGALGLSRFTVRVAALDDLERVTSRLTAAGHAFERSGDAVTTRDLDNIAVVVSNAS